MRGFVFLKRKRQASRPAFRVSMKRWVTWSDFTFQYAIDCKVLAAMHDEIETDR
jgi:hypothetical protein